jgi:hypothetical protein
MIINIPGANGEYGSIGTPSECLSSFGSSGYLNVQQALSSATITVNNYNALTSSGTSSNVNQFAAIAVNNYTPGRINWQIPNFVSSQS